jgi:hypothetical protein
MNRAELSQLYIYLSRQLGNPAPAFEFIMEWDLEELVDLIQELLCQAHCIPLTSSEIKSIYGKAKGQKEKSPEPH